MNKILLIYSERWIKPYIWECNISENIEDVLSYCLTLGLPNFDIIETTLDLGTYQRLFEEHLYDSRFNLNEVIQ